MKDKKLWMTTGVVALAFLLIGMFVMPMIGFAVNPNASSKVINDVNAMYGSLDSGTTSPMQWYAVCVATCGGEFNHNVNQYDICVEKCTDEVNAFING